MTPGASPTVRSKPLVDRKLPALAARCKPLSVSEVIFRSSRSNKPKCYEMKPKIAKLYKIKNGRMPTLEEMRNTLIAKISKLENEELLMALDTIVSDKSAANDTKALTKVQLEMLRLSDIDIEQGNLISQEDMDSRNLEWLNEG
jgi:hypothetical protein